MIPANYNSPVQTVVSGTKEGVDEAVRLAGEEGLTCMPLAVSAPFHCQLMKPAGDRLQAYFADRTFNDPKIPVYMNFTAEALKSGSEAPELLVSQASGPVQWVKTLQHMADQGIDTFIECGPGRTLSGLVRKTLKGVTIQRVENLATLDKTLELFA